MDVFTALADPTRRSIIEMLAEGESNAGQIAEAFPVSRPAISRHLRVLRETGLVSASEVAQQRIYRLERERLAEVGDWVDRHRRFWGERLDSLTAKLEGEGSS